MNKNTFYVVLVLFISGCATTFPDNPYPEELHEMHVIMNECLEDLVPLETHFSGTCKNVEDALVKHYGSLNKYTEAQKAFNE